MSGTRPPFPSHEGLRDLARAFAEERDLGGLPPPTEFPVRRELLIASSREHALQDALQRSAKRYATYVKWGIGHDLDATSGTFRPNELHHTEQHFILGAARGMRRATGAPAGQDSG